METKIKLLEDFVCNGHFITNLCRTMERLFSRMYSTKQALRKVLVNSIEHILDGGHFWKKNFQVCTFAKNELHYIFYHVWLAETLFGRLLLVNFNAMKQKYKERKIEKLRELGFIKTFLLHFYFLLILFKKNFLIIHNTVGLMFWKWFFRGRIVSYLWRHWNYI